MEPDVPVTMTWYVPVPELDPEVPEPVPDPDPVPVLPEPPLPVDPLPPLVVEELDDAVGCKLPPPPPQPRIKPIISIDSSELKRARHFCEPSRKAPIQNSAATGKHIASEALSEGLLDDNGFALKVTEA